MNTGNQATTPPLLSGSSRGLLALVLILSLIAWYTAGRPQLGEMDKRLIFGLRKGFDDGQVTALTIRRGADLSEELRFERLASPRNAPPIWQMRKPYDELADAEQIASLLAPMSFMQADLIYDSIQGLGFDTPTLTVELTREALPPLRFKVGKALPGGSYALQIEDEPDRGYVFRTSFLEKLQAPVSDFRLRDLFTLDFKGLEAIEVKLASPLEGLAPRAVSLVKDQGFWKLGSATGEFADEELVERIYRGIDKLEARVVLDSELWGPATKTKYKLDSPILTLSLRGEGRLETALFGVPAESARAGELTAQFQDRPGIYLVSILSLVELLKLEENELRSRSLVPLGGLALERITVAWPKGGESALQREGRDWQDPASPQAKVDQDRARDLVDQVLAWKIRDFKPLELGGESARVRFKAGGLERELIIGARLSAEAPLYALRRRESEATYAAELPGVEALLGLPISLRDPKIFDFDKLSIGRLDWLKGGQSLRILREDRRFIVEGAPLASQDLEAIDGLVTRLSKLRARRFGTPLATAPLADYGLDAPAKLTVFHETWDNDARQQKLLETTIETGKMSSEGGIWARVSGCDAVVELEAGVFEVLANGFKKS
jgi:hypothetical protein